MQATWLILPIVDSRDLKKDFLEEIIHLMSLHLSRSFSAGRERRGDLVLRTHPNMVFTSSSWPSALNFFIDMMSFLGIMSRETVGRAIVCIVRGSTLLNLIAFSPISRVTSRSSYIYIYYIYNLLGCQEGLLLNPLLGGRVCCLEVTLGGQWSLRKGRRGCCEELSWQRLQ